MNSLSWVIYTIQLLGSLDTFLGSLAGFLFFTGGAAFLIRVITADSKEDDAPQFHAKMSRYVRWAIPGGFFVAFLNVVVPDRNTMLLIAASQIGERVVTSQSVQNVVDPSVDLLKTWIEEQTRTLRRSNDRNGR